MADYLFIHVLYGDFISSFEFRSPGCGGVIAAQCSFQSQFNLLDASENRSFVSRGHRFCFCFFTPISGGCVLPSRRGEAGTNCGGRLNGDDIDGERTRQVFSERSQNWERGSEGGRSDERKRLNCAIDRFNLRRSDGDRLRVEMGLVLFVDGVGAGSDDAFRTEAGINRDNDRR